MSDSGKSSGFYNIEDPMHPMNRVASTPKTVVADDSALDVKALDVVRMHEGGGHLGVVFPNGSILGVRVLRTFQRDDLDQLAALVEGLQRRIADRNDALTLDDFEVGSALSFTMPDAPEVVSEEDFVKLLAQHLEI